MNLCTLNTTIKQSAEIVPLRGFIKTSYLTTVGSGSVCV